MFDGDPIAVAVSQDTGNEIDLYDRGTVAVFRDDYDGYRVEEVDGDAE